jgi:signal transduction histidine kinase
VPAMIVHYAVARDKGRYGAPLIKPGYVIGLLSSLLTLVAPPPLAPLGRIAAPLLALIAAALFARTFATEKRGSALPFLGAFGLTVFVVYDSARSIFGLPNLPATGFGLALFALALFVSQIIEFTKRRERLIGKTSELRKRSQDLGRMFSELRAAQSELVRKEQLAVVGELSAVVAHEVRNPLAVITNAVATLKRPNIDAEARETLLGILSEETARLNQLVGDLLHYARPLSVEPESVALQDLIAKVTSPLQNRVDLDFDIKTADDTPRVGGDPLLLRQALENVVNNAAQAMPTGGVITIELGPVFEGCDGVALTVRDDGEGMDTVVRQRALDPFFTTRPAGTGLGLAIVARVVDAHSGRLTIRSERGSGTEVRIFLPLHPENAPPSSSRPRLLPTVIERLEGSEPIPKRKTPRSKVTTEGSA